MRLVKYVLVAFALAAAVAGWVGFIRWYTDGAHDCSNCEP